MARRFGIVTGEAEVEWLSYRLAVVLNKIPTFIPKGSQTQTISASVSTSQLTSTDDSHSEIGSNHSNGHSNVNGNGNGNGNSAINENDINSTSNQKNSQNSQDKERTKKVPSVWEKVLEKYRYPQAMNNLTNKFISNQKFENNFPQIGIQRTVTAAVSAEGIR